MTKEDFNDLVLRLKRGDNTALSYLHPFQDGCIRMLVVKSNARCDQDTAYDLFVDAILDFRKNILQDKVEFQNVQAYLRRICWNKWLASARTTNRQDSKLGIVASTLYAHAETETIEEMEELYTSRMAQVEEAMQQLSEQCRKILCLAIAEELSMSEIARQLNLASADVAKTTKSRCYKKLLELIRKSPKP
jgi:RNA polymerase sigma factor (sigma-70 family)